MSPDQAAPTTKLFPLGGSALRVPRLGVGAMTWGEPRGLWRLHPSVTAYGRAASREDEAAAFAASMAGGATFFDVAATYGGGSAELRLGELARGSGAIIASKFPRAVMPAMKVERFPAELEGSLGRLGGRIDLYQHHWPLPQISIPRLMNLMADAWEAGRIGAIGVSNYSVEQMREAHAVLARRGIPLASNQVQYSLLRRRVEIDGTLEACRELGVTLIAYSPLASGLLSGKYGASRPKARGMRRFLPTFSRRGLEEAEPVLALLRRIGERYGRTPSQVALRWLIENPIVLPIAGAKNGAQAQENAGALSFSLTGDEVEELSRAAEAWRTIGWRR